MSKTVTTKQLDVGHRIHTNLLYINGEPMLKAKARKETKCAASGKPINKGDEVYWPFSNSSTRSSRFLASEIDLINEMDKRHA